MAKERIDIEAENNPYRAKVDRDGERKREMRFQLLSNVCATRFESEENHHI